MLGANINADVFYIKSGPRVNKFNFIPMIVLRLVLLHEVAVRKQWVTNLAQDNRNLNVLVDFPEFETRDDGYRVYTPPGDKIKDTCKKLQLRVT